MVGEAIQKDMMGASGTPLASSPAITGMTVQEQKGLNAPTAVAATIAMPILLSKARRIALLKIELVDEHRQKDADEKERPHFPNGRCNKGDNFNDVVHNRSP